MNGSEKNITLVIKRRSYRINVCDLVKEIQCFGGDFTVFPTFPEYDWNKCLRIDLFFMYLV